MIANLRAVQSIHGLMTLRTTRSRDEAGRIVLAPGATWGELDDEGARRPRPVRRRLPRLGPGARTRGRAQAGPARRRTTTASEPGVVEEGRLMARVRHPNVVTIHGAQRIDGVSGCGWSSSRAGRWLPSWPSAARLPPTSCDASAPSWPGRWKRCTRPGWCTGTSRPERPARDEWARGAGRLRHRSRARRSGRHARRPGRHALVPRPGDLRRPAGDAAERYLQSRRAAVPSGHR